jgi:hypothetical protein
VPTELSRSVTRLISVRPEFWATTVESGPVMMTVLLFPMMVGRTTVEF